MALQDRRTLGSFTTGRCARRHLTLIRIDALLKVASFNGEVEMRRSDHQLQQPLYMLVWQRAGGKFTYSPENTGMTLAAVKEIPNYFSSTHTS